MFSWYKYLIVNLVFSHLGFWSGNLFSDCAFSSSLPSCTLFRRYTSSMINTMIKIIPDSRIRNSICKGPKYKFPSYINFDKCREEIACAFHDFASRWCKREVLRMVLLRHGKDGTGRQRSRKCAFRKRFLLQKQRWEKPKLTIRYLYHENIS